MEAKKEIIADKAKIAISSLTANETNYFLEMLPEIKETILDGVRNLKLGPTLNDEVEKYFSACLDHTCMGGKMTRGLTVLLTVKCINNQKELEGKLLKSASILGWCVEIMQAFFLVADDVMDSSHTRRGKPCWFRLPTVLFANAINDSIFLCCSIYRLLHRYFSMEMELYPLLFDLLQEMSFATVIGQHLDTNALPKDDYNFESVTPSHYSAIVRHKTAYYSFYLPCALGMLLAGLREASIFDRTKAVCMELGEYFQTQDDYLDAYAPSEILGKIGTDIEERKCSWLLLQALERISPEEKAQLTCFYGNKDAEKIQWVKDLYKKYKLSDVYKEYEENQKPRISALIKAVNHAGLQIGLTKLLDKIFKRPF
ncbi:polyprenyl synthetase superfamily protein [Cardiosporidium cionae]|uniref:Polyprenyl synthetase superfamily protein n=1 Tax=Cardiosporidium cionae TaxID=476202 RepID=A0ABQ7J7Y6_9APIC|nr:polyprenyl synthetase superfamily protein [Cardiosporidium cionae]|eukprot:KAF8820106.1 polyprenyl synthetase superfamily protein [Cardiosporidium cionae]